MNQKQQERLYDESELAKNIYARGVAAMLITGNKTEVQLAGAANTSLVASKIFFDMKDNHIAELNKVK